MTAPEQDRDEPALEVLGLHKRYREHHAVGGVDLVVRPGEVHGLLGPNGAGKTTLMRMVLGLVQPDAGTVRLLGGAARTAVGVVPEGVAGFADTPRFYPYLSGRKNLRLLARLDGASSPAAEESRVTEVLGQAGLAGRADARVGGYSAGMRQRLGLAAALLRRPRLLLLDEPTNSLDPAGARELRAQVRRLAAGGVAVLLSSHDMAEVEDLCAAVTILRHGSVVFSGSIDELRKRAPRAVHRLRTSDDTRARSVSGAEVTAAPEGDGLDVCAGESALDAYVLALGRAGIAVRSLESKDRSLESLFLRLTDDSALDSPPGPAPEPLPRRPQRTGESAVTARGALAAARVECAKVAAQLKAWAVLVTCLLGPFAFAVAMRVQSSMPEDTLFGRSVKASGFAVPLVVLGFAASWAFPVLTSVVGGDLFSAEDRYGTWPTVLTRSRSRGEVFAGKVLTALAFSTLAVTVLAAGSLLAGVLLIGRQPLLGLSGMLLAPGRSLALITAAWASVLPPVFAFTAVAVLLSVSTRSSAAGIGLPVLLGFAMEMTAFVNVPEAVRRLLLSPAFVAWHGLFGEPRYYGPLVDGAAISAACFVGCLAAAYRIVCRRDVGS